MKKILLSSVCILMLAQPAFANDGPDGDKGGKGPRHGKIFQDMDTNSDGSVTKAESQAFHEKHFDEVDTNKDGKLTKDEVKDFHQKKKALREKAKHD
ncbi:MAG: EF-hand domain-containing protein [Alphaproteobacteria bacterium]|nr:EF-hand domain-containing protein [Alphaproteobacteria bacterium]